MHTGSGRCALGCLSREVAELIPARSRPPADRPARRARAPPPLSQLERMKRALPGAVEIKGELPAGPVDDEIERMKAEIAAKNAPPAADAKATAADAKAPPPSA